MGFKFVVPKDHPPIGHLCASTTARRPLVETYGSLRRNESWDFVRGTESRVENNSYSSPEMMDNLFWNLLLERLREIVGASHGAQHSARS